MNGPGTSTTSSTASPTAPASAATAPPSTSSSSPSSPASSAPHQARRVHHVRTWRGDNLATSASSSLVAWAITALAFGLACKEIHIGGYRGWRLRVLEAFVIILAFTQLLYVLALHSGLFGNQFGNHAGGGGYPAEHGGYGAGDPHNKGMATGGVARV
ncbi:hypothetical protein ZWY2020_032673 [Hordeum vulgare]|nr:hypothetical protein ZWY2020_032673 [Hordeum vulgare]